MATRVTPTFLLKGVDPNKVLSDYNNGYFSNNNSNKSEIKLANNTAILAPNYGTNNLSPIFCLKDKNNCNIIIATTGHSDFQIYTTQGGSLPTGGRCDFCKEDFTNTAVGYPVGYQEQTLLSNNDGASKYRIFYTFWVEGKFCSFECALGYVQLILAHPSYTRDTTIRDSEHLLKLLYKLMYPTSNTLRPSQDPRLLKVNGGSLSKEEWQDNRHIYVRTDRILMIPAKVEYVQQNFLNPVTSIDYSRDSSITT